MTKDITLEIEEDGLSLCVTYQCRIRRTPNGDTQGRKWWEPDVDSDLINVSVNDCDEYELDWMYGEDMPARVEQILETFHARLDRMLYERAKEMVNEPNYEDTP